MRRILFVLVVVACLAIPSVAFAAPRADKVTGDVTFGAEGSSYTFEAFEAVGKPGDPAYRLVKGSVTVSGLAAIGLPDGTYPVTDVEVYSDTSFTIFFDVNGRPFWTNGWIDGGEPGWKFDSAAWGSFPVTAGNIQVHNYADDGD